MKKKRFLKSNHLHNCKYILYLKYKIHFALVFSEQGQGTKNFAKVIAKSQKLISQFTKL